MADTDTPHLGGVTVPTIVPTTPDGDGVAGVGAAGDTEAGDGAAGVGDGVGDTGDGDAGSRYLPGARKSALGERPAKAGVPSDGVGCGGLLRRCTCLGRCRT